MSKNTSKTQNTQPYEHDLAKLKKSELPQTKSPVTEQDFDNQPDNQQQHFQEDFNKAAHLGKSHHSEEEEEQDEVPSDKDKLIEYLKETLKRAEMTMGTVFVAIQIEKDKRNKLVEEITEKKNEVDEINEQENNFLSEKVNEKMATALERALGDKEAADNEYSESQQKMDELESAINELDENIQSIHIEKSQKEVELQDTQYKINEQESMIDSFNVELEKLNEKHKERATKITELTTEVTDMKGIIESLTDVRVKLNHYLKDETPSQSRQGARNARPSQDPRASGDLRASGDGHSVFDLPNKTNNQPSDDDFWYGEAKGKYRASNEQQRRVEGQEPWQAKVQYYDLPPEQNAGHTPVKLPNINAPRPEYLYKNKEYVDEFGSPNQRTMKKGQVQPKRRVY